MKEQTISVSPFARYFYLISGIILVTIGVIGIFLPLLPTTIFLILASICFLKSSPKANEWLRNHKILGVYIDNYQNKSGLTLNSKITNIIILWISISLSAFFLTDELYIKIILLLIAIGVTIHLLMIKTKEPTNKNNFLSK
jgi:uncharacterized membrane protein YbaN (DUF454 family)